jgi:hypothetical protein
VGSSRARSIHAHINRPPLCCQAMQGLVLADTQTLVDCVRHSGVGSLPAFSVNAGPALTASWRPVGNGAPFSKAIERAAAQGLAGR